MTEFDGRNFISMYSKNRPRWCKSAVATPLLLSHLWITLLMGSFRNCTLKDNKFRKLSKFTAVSAFAESCCRSPVRSARGFKISTISYKFWQLKSTKSWHCIVKQDSDWRNCCNMARTEFHRVEISTMSVSSVPSPPKVVCNVFSLSSNVGVRRISQTLKRTRWIIGTRSFSSMSHQSHHGHRRQLRRCLIQYVLRWS